MPVLHFNFKRPGYDSYDFNILIKYEKLGFVIFFLHMTEILT